jgi:anti-anti-sigma factor
MGENGNQGAILIIRPEAKVGSWTIEVYRRKPAGDETLVFTQVYAPNENWVTDLGPVLGQSRQLGVGNVIVDIARVEWFNSTALGMLMVLFQEVSREGGKIVFANPSERVTKILAATKLDRVLTAVGSLEEAVGLLA